MLWCCGDCTSQNIVKLNKCKNCKKVYPINVVECCEQFDIINYINKSGYIVSKYIKRRSNNLD